MPSLNYNTEHNSTAFLKRTSSDDRLHDSTAKAIGLGDLDLQSGDAERAGAIAQGLAGHWYRWWRLPEPLPAVW